MHPTQAPHLSADGKRRTERGSHLGVTHWVVERTFASLHQFRRLRVRY
jgi:transposase